MVGQMETFHIAVKNSPTTAFEAPITEVHFSTLKASGEHNREALLKFSNNGEALLESTAVPGLRFPVSWGECLPISSPTSLCGVVGFDNLEVSGTSHERIRTCIWLRDETQFVDKLRAEDPGNLLVKANELVDLKSYRVEYKKVTLWSTIPEVGRVIPIVQSSWMTLSGDYHRFHWSQKLLVSDQKCLYLQIMTNHTIMFNSLKLDWFRGDRKLGPIWFTGISQG